MSRRQGFSAFSARRRRTVSRDRPSCSVEHDHDVGQQLERPARAARRRGRAGGGDQQRLLLAAQLALSAGARGLGQGEFVVDGFAIGAVARQTPGGRSGRCAPARRAPRESDWPRPWWRSRRGAAPRSRRTGHDRLHRRRSRLHSSTRAYATVRANTSRRWRIRMASSHFGQRSSAPTRASTTKSVRRHLDRYVCQFAGKHNYRNADTIDQMADAVASNDRQAVDVPRPDRRQRAGVRGAILLIAIGFYVWRIFVKITHSGIAANPIQTSSQKQQHSQYGDRIDHPLPNDGHNHCDRQDYQRDY